MRLLTAPERHMQQPLAIVQRLQIIDIAAMAGEQTRIFQSWLTRADQTTGGRGWNVLRRPSMQRHGLRQGWRRAQS